MGYDILESLEGEGKKNIVIQLQSQKQQQIKC